MRHSERSLGETRDDGKRIDPNKPNFAYELQVTFTDGKNQNQIRASRRRTLAKVIEEVKRRKKCLKVKVVRSLNFREYKEHREAKGVIISDIVPRQKKSKKGPTRRIGEPVYLLAVQLAALEGRDPKGTPDELLRPMLEAALAEGARKILLQG